MRTNGSLATVCVSFAAVGGGVSLGWEAGARAKEPAPEACGKPAEVVRLDIIDLSRGVETPGREDLAAAHEGFVYWFASEANRDAFLAEPAARRIQWGGACGRMGPLSGKGAVARYGTHDGRVFLFASDACRTTFLQSPEKFVEGPEAPPKFDTAKRERARAALGRAEAAFGAEALAGVRTYVEFSEAESESRGEKVRTTSTFTAQFPASFRRDDTWGEEYAWGDVVTREDAFSFSSDGPEALASDQREALLRMLAHHPLVILRSRGEPGFVAGHAGEGEIDGARVEFVDVWMWGAATRLAIDAQSGRVVSARYRGRGPNLTVGDVEIRYGDWREAGVVTAPFARQGWFNGERAEGVDATLTAVRVNEPVEEGFFVRKAGPGA